MAAAWFLCRLAVSGPADDLDEFTRSAQGPGIVDWFAGFYLETLPDAVAAPFRRVLLDMRHAGELAAAKDPKRCPFDLSALVPIPDDVRRAGWHAAGRAWCLRNWGVAYLPRRVECEAGERRVYVETKRRGRGRLATLTVPQVVYTFISEGAAPLPIIDTIRSRWPKFEVRFSALELEAFQSGSRDKVNEAMARTVILAPRERGRGTDFNSGVNSWVSNRGRNQATEHATNWKSWRMGWENRLMAYGTHPFALIHLITKA